MLNQVFPIVGNKIFSFVADENSLKFSSQNKFSTVDEFLTAWQKKLSLSTKVEIKYDSIKSIQKEDNSKSILIIYKTWAGIPSNCQFSFNNAEDYEIFFSYMEKERYFIRTHEILTPFKAIQTYLLGLAITIALTIFSYYQALAIANGTNEEAHNRNARIFDALIGLLGDKGVLAAGAAVACYLLYKIWIRFKNPPNQIKFLPPKGY